MLLDALQVAGQYGWIVTGGLIAMMASGWLINREVHKVLAYFDRLDDRIDRVMSACTTNSGEIFNADLHMAELNSSLRRIATMNEAFHEAYKDHIEDTKRLASEELWKHCPIERCANLGKIVNFLNEISNELKSFAMSAKESRERTQKSVADISTRIDKFIDGLGGEILATIRDIRR